MKSNCRLCFLTLLLCCAVNGSVRLQSSNNMKNANEEAKMAANSSSLLPFILKTTGPWSWSSWSSWSPCSSSCLRQETQTRSRTCVDVAGNTVDKLSPCIDEQSNEEQQGAMQMGNIQMRPCVCPVHFRLARLTQANSSSASLLTSSGPRFCDMCEATEVCLAFPSEALPTCKAGLDVADPTGCQGLCRIDTQRCCRLHTDAFRCKNLIQNNESNSEIDEKALGKVVSSRALNITGEP